MSICRSVLLAACSLGVAQCVFAQSANSSAAALNAEKQQSIDDFVAKTAVVYDWDARAARLRWLARKDGTMHQGLSHQRSLVPPTRPPARPPEPPTPAPSPRDQATA